MFSILHLSIHYLIYCYTLLHFTRYTKLIDGALIFIFSKICQGENRLNTVLTLHFLPTLLLSILCLFWQEETQQYMFIEDEDQKMVNINIKLISFVTWFIYLAQYSLWNQPELFFILSNKDPILNWCTLCVVFTNYIFRNTVPSAVMEEKCWCVKGNSATSNLLLLSSSLSSSSLHPHPHPHLHYYYYHYYYVLI